MLGAKDATPRRACHPASSRLLRVGDAFLTVDPLSSSGLYVAAVSAVQASRVANTILRRPDDAAVTCAFYATSQANIAASLESDGAAHDGAPGPDHGVLPPSPAPLSDLVLAPGFRLGEAGVLTESFIERRPVLRLQSGRSLALVDDWPIERLLAPLMGGSSLLDAMEVWSGLSPDTRLQLIGLLVTEGLLTPRGPPPTLPAAASAAAPPTFEQVDGGWP